MAGGEGGEGALEIQRYRYRRMPLDWDRFPGEFQLRVQSRIPIIARFRWGCEKFHWKVNTLRNPLSNPNGSCAFWLGGCPVLAVWPERHSSLV